MNRRKGSIQKSIFVSLLALLMVISLVIPRRQHVQSHQAACRVAKENILTEVWLRFL